MSSRASRAAAKKNAASVSLLPFLAVLICTMGALIVLLVLVVQQARAQIEDDSQQQAAEWEKKKQEHEQQLRDLEDLQWRSKILEGERETLLGQSSRGREELDYLEQRIRNLEQKQRQLLAEAKTIEQLKQNQKPDDDPVKLASLQQQIAQEQAANENLRREIAQRKPSFTLIPYDGPNGTKRRPIYIECRADGVILQPEGMKFFPRDFSGPLGEGNPLNACLQAVRRHWRELRQEGQGDPYPLLVVRPDGVGAYLQARRGLKDWDDEFGYELIEQELELAYPKPDPALAQILQQTARVTRQRQAALAAAMPNRFKMHSAPPSFAFIDAPGGGGSASGAGRGAGSASGGRDPRAARPDGPGGSAGSPPQDPNQQQNPGPPGSVQPLAGQRGAQWANPGAKKSRGTAVQRPIYIDCHRDRLVVFREKDSPLRAQVVPMPGTTQLAVDKLVEVVQSQIEDWGIALNGGYWRPVLKIRTSQDAASRFRDLEVLLQGSGLDLERRY